MRSQPLTQDRDEDRPLRDVWTFAVLTSDLPQDGDWIARDLWGRSIFIQRFDDHLRAFENLCAHRFYPLRTSRSGNGPLRCGFHGWCYGEDGAPTTIPLLEEVFDRPESARERRLRRLDLATCGDLVFVRRRSQAPGLDEYLGDFGPIVRSLTAGIGRAVRTRKRAAAHWKRNYEMTLDDYHIVAVHPRSLGARGPLRRGHYRYHRAGFHSALFAGPVAVRQDLSTMSHLCAAGRYHPEGYRIINIFPNLIVAHAWFAGRWLVVVSEYARVGVDESCVTSWSLPMKLPPDVPVTMWARLPDRCYALMAAAFGYRVACEDGAVAERLQSVARESAGASPCLSLQEQRIAWYREAYDAIVAARGESAPTTRAS